ncbi:MAG: Asp23/Gls24 family envelope stress response protein [Clostridiaceae bacterium]|nr:Asp23/Gls24 family envelope stress response protein [Clostridiaceae bacterium]MCI9483946.1 Asp23/Gls24 family envelope stress response protein [Clostridiaceae bacterium]MDE7035141.1 Asp23/Gls24 family envelope stress response protein [Eubacteriales bacterium]NBH80041.1 Asp23/Gls24 family envelope stress response protein [Clostridiaceae bacterium]NBI81377.1 Asp23/Gls24 family envelope stress response protein [Clostridiaceae bacterium]
MADHKEYWSTTGDQGTIKISEDVVASIAALTAAETEGVSGLCASLTSELAGLLGRKNMSKGVRVEFVGEDAVMLEIGFLAEFGCPIREVARQVQENVRSAVKSMAGLDTTAVNVHVGGVTFPAPQEAAPAAE